MRIKAKKFGSVKVIASVAMDGSDLTSSYEKTIGFKESFGLRLITKDTEEKEANGRDRFSLVASVFAADGKSLAKNRTITWTIEKQTSTIGKPMNVKLLGVNNDNTTTTGTTGLSTVRVVALDSGEVSIAARITDDESGSAYSDRFKYRRLKLRFKKTLNLASVVSDNSGWVEADNQQFHTMTAKVLSTGGLPVNGRTVTWRLEKNNIFAAFMNGMTEATSQTGASGEATIQVKASDRGSVSVVASVPKHDGVDAKDNGLTDSNHELIWFKKALTAPYCVMWRDAAKLLLKRTGIHLCHYPCSSFSPPMTAILPVPVGMCSGEWLIRVIRAPCC